MVMVMIILIINVLYVSFATIRMILILKGQKYLAASLSTLEVIIYIIGLGLVLDNLNEIQNIIAYAIGYALGVLAGTKIEEMLALGYVTVQVITNHYDQHIPNKLREHGFGVTSWMGEGRDGPRLVMEILTRRKQQQDLYNQVITLDPHAFIIALEPKHFHGGFWVGGLKKSAHLQGKQYKVVNESNLPISIDRETQMKDAQETDTEKN